MTADRPTARLFIAWWPDDEARAALAACRDRWAWPAGARPVATANLHATLHFLGSVERERIGALEAALAGVPPREVRLDARGTAVWRGGIAVLTLRADAAGDALHADLGAAVHRFGIALDPRPFAPHVTLARKATGAVAPGELPAFDWRATGFMLVESLPGPPARYEPLAAWP